MDGAGTQRAVKDVVAGVTQSLMPQVRRGDSGGEGEVAIGLRDWVDFIVRFTPEDHPLRPSILDKETHIVKFNINGIVTR